MLMLRLPMVVVAVVAAELQLLPRQRPRRAAIGQAVLLLLLLSLFRVVVVVVRSGQREREPGRGRGRRQRRCRTVVLVLSVVAEGVLVAALVVVAHPAPVETSVIGRQERGGEGGRVGAAGGGERRTVGDHTPAVGVHDVLQLLLMVVVMMFMTAPSTRLRHKTGGSGSCGGGGSSPCTTTATASTACHNSRHGRVGRHITAAVDPHPLRRAPGGDTGATQNILHAVEHAGPLQRRDRWLYWLFSTVPLLLTVSRPVVVVLKPISFFDDKKITLFVLRTANGATQTTWHYCL